MFQGYIGSIPSYRISSRVQKNSYESNFNERKQYKIVEFENGENYITYAAIFIMNTVEEKKYQQKTWRWQPHQVSWKQDQVKLYSLTNSQWELVAWLIRSESIMQRVIIIVAHVHAWLLTNHHHITAIITALPHSQGHSYYHRHYHYYYEKSKKKGSKFFIHHTIPPDSLDCRGRPGRPPILHRPASLSKLSWQSRILIIIIFFWRKNTIQDLI